MANQSANHFTLTGGGFNGIVDTAGLTGDPVINITVDGKPLISPSLSDTQNGFEVSALIEQVPDSHTVRLALLIPHVNLSGTTVPFTGVGILTTAQTTIGGEPLVNGVVHTYDVRSASGTADAVAS